MMKDFRELSSCRLNSRRHCAHVLVGGVCMLNGCHQSSLSKDLTGDECYLLSPAGSIIDLSSGKSINVAPSTSSALSPFFSTDQKRIFWYIKKSNSKGVIESISLNAINARKTFMGIPSNLILAGSTIDGLQFGFIVYHENRYFFCRVYQQRPESVIESFEIVHKEEHGSFQGLLLLADGSVITSFAKSFELYRGAQLLHSAVGSSVRLDGSGRRIAFMNDKGLFLYNSSGSTRKISDDKVDRLYGFNVTGSRILAFNAKTQDLCSYFVPDNNRRESKKLCSRFNPELAYFAGITVPFAIDKKLFL